MDEPTFEFTLTELKLLYKFLEHEYIRDLQVREVVNKIQLIVESHEQLG